MASLPHSLLLPSCSHHPTWLLSLFLCLHSSTLHPQLTRVCPASHLLEFPKQRHSSFPSPPWAFTLEPHLRNQLNLDSFPLWIPRPKCPWFSLFSLGVLSAITPKCPPESCMAHLLFCDFALLQSHNGCSVVPQGIGTCLQHSTHILFHFYPASSALPCCHRGCLCRPTSILAFIIQMPWFLVSDHHGPQHYCICCSSKSILALLCDRFPQLLCWIGKSLFPAQRTSQQLPAGCAGTLGVGQHCQVTRSDQTRLPCS